MNKLNYIDLFSGCGGLSDGFEQSGYYNFLAGVEWEKSANDVYRRRLETKWKVKDVAKKALHFDIQKTEELFFGYDGDEYSKHKGLIKICEDKTVDVIIGGPPCQAYSIAGRVQDKDGMKNDYRNYLFENYIKVVDQFKPKIIVFENVPGILSAKPDGEVLAVELVRKEFLKHGYEIINNIKKYALLDASDFGVAQQRKRIILFGLKQELFGDKTQEKLQILYHLLYEKKASIKKSVQDVIGDLPKFFELEKDIKVDGKKFSHYPQKSNVPDHTPRYHNKRDIAIFRELALDKENGTNKYLSTEALKKMYTEKTGKKSSIHKYNVLNSLSLSNSIVAHLYKDGLRHIHPDYKQSRSITVREAARLQSFDDDFLFSGIMGNDYKMIGNAVPPKMALALASTIFEFAKINNL
jgi:DNA (cytosine-5)-methyltransferase 1